MIANVVLAAAIAALLYRLIQRAADRLAALEALAGMAPVELRVGRGHVAFVAFLAAQACLAGSGSSGGVSKAASVSCSISRVVASDGCRGVAATA